MAHENTPPPRHRRPRRRTVGSEWSVRRDAFGSRFSPLTQITRDNVSRLEVAWTYRTGETERTRQTKD
jgi:glucose dehydrogenase